MKSASSKRRLNASGIIVSTLVYLMVCLTFLYLSRTQAEPKSQQIKKTAQTTQTAKVSAVSPNALWQEAEILRAQQRAESNHQAVEKYKAAADLWRAAGEFEPAARGLRAAGEVHQILGDLQTTLSVFKVALELSRRAKSQTEEAKVLNGLAYAHFLQGDPKAARDESLEALKLARLIGDQGIEAAALSNLGESFFSFGDLTSALKHQQQASDLWRKRGDLKGLALSEIALGYYSANMSEPGRALGYLEQGLLSAKQVNDLRTQALAFTAIANVKAKFGNKQEALDAYSQARPLAEGVGDRLFLASILGGTASVYFRMGDARTALDYDQRAVEIFEEVGAMWGKAEATLDLGRINNSLGDFQKAIQCLTDALQLFRTLGMRRLEAQALQEIGVVQNSTGEREIALSSLQKSLALNRIGQDFRHEANALNLIGKVYEDSQQRDRALQYYQRALPLSRAAADPAGESNSLFNIARIERDRGNLLDAEQNLKSAIGIAESTRSKVSSQDLRASYFATIHEIYELYIDVLMLLHKLRPAAGLDSQAFALSEKARARSFLELLQEGQANVREGVDPVLLKKERSLSEALNAKADRHMKLLAARDIIEADKTKNEIDALTTEYAGVRDQIRATSPRYAALTLPEPLNLSEVQQRLLDDNSILLEYSLGNDRSYVWVVTRSSHETFELSSRKIIEDSARRLYSDFVAHQMIPGESVEQHLERKRKASESTPANTALLSNLVLGPLAGKLSNKRLVIIPDGALQYIPFQALNDPDSDKAAPQQLVANHEIVNELSASTLAVLEQEAKERKTASNSVAVLADPVFEVDDPRVNRASVESTPESTESLKVKQALRDVGISVDGVEIPRLLASSDEADAIMKSAPWGTGLKAVGFEATRARVLGPELSGYRVIHFATHGMINNEHPDLSGIVLSLFDREGHSQDGFLRLHDIYNLHLPADLVVLSACSTGLGKDVRGEGLIGLTRGFMYAGASGVVASLWKVDDQATAELMKLFYAGMFQKGLPPVAALREAQLAMSQQNQWRSPYYWAGFVIQGRYDERIGESHLTYITPKRILTLAGFFGILLITALLTLLGRRRKHI